MMSDNKDQDVQDTFPVSLVEDVKELLGRLKAEVDASKIEGTDHNDCAISLTASDSRLLASLYDEGVIKHPIGYEALGSISSPKNMTTQGYSKILHKLTQENSRWPVNVVFDNLTFEADIPVSDPHYQTVASSFISLLTGIPKKIMGLNAKKTNVILDNLSGVFEAGTMTLVMGPPGSGMSTLFKALSDSIVLTSNSRLNGNVKYSGYSKDELIVRKFASYISQVDLHTPTLTVRETLDFAFKCFGGDHKVYGAPVEEIYTTTKVSGITIFEVLDDLVDFVLTQYGLRNCADTIVGGQMLRGISGGEKRRVTTCELIVGRKPLVFFDQLSTGLDAAATFDICKDLKSLVANLKNTYVFSLLQPAPQVYELFDEVLILAEGKILFHDRRENVLPFFDSIGYSCPKQLAIAEFIQEVTTDIRSKYINKEVGVAIPQNNAEIATAWEDSAFAKERLERTAKIRKQGKEDNKLVLLMKNGSSVFCTDFFSDFKMVFARESKLFYRNKPYLFARIIQCIIMGIVIGTVFYDLPADLSEPANIQQRVGLLFFLCLQSMLSGFALVPTVFQSREIFYKQSRAFMHRTFSYVVSAIVVAIPMQIFETFLLCTLTFWLSAVVPLDNDFVVSAYFALILMMFLINAVIAGFLRMVACLVPDSDSGFVLTGISVASSVLFSGFIIYPDNIPPWFIWIYWISPLSYTLRSMALFVFGAFSDQEREAALNQFSIESDPNYKWYGVAYLIGCYLLNFVIVYLAMRFIRFDVSGRRKGNNTAVVEKSKSSVRKIENPANGNNGSTAGEKEVEVRSQSSAVGSVLRSMEFVPVNVVFKNLGYSVPTADKKSTIQLLSSIDGFARAGTMTALMGASGAGKTTLLDVLANRKTEGKVEGEIYFNGAHYSKEFASLVGYVEQEDIHSPHQTVEEAIYFSAILRQKFARSKSQLHDFVETIITTFELESLREFEVGIKGSGGLSVEQMKRLTIAVEMTANPSVLFCDEPTSGLDSRAATVIMRGIKKVALSGRTVVCTIHQPNRGIFESFDKLLLLKKGGKTVFFEDIGNSSQNVVNYFQAIPGTKPIPDERYNPADYMLEVIGAGTSSVVNMKNKVDFYAHYVSTQHQENLATMDVILNSKATNLGNMRQGVQHAPYWRQQRLLFDKTFKSYWRNPGYNFIRIMFAAFMALLWGTAYLGLGSDQDGFKATTAFSILGVLFNSMVFVGAINANMASGQVAIERGPYYRERASRMYSSFPYALAWSLVEIPYVLVATLLFCSILYFMIGLHASAVIFFKYWVTFFLYVLAMTNLGHVSSILLPNAQAVTVIMGLLISLFAVFAGFLIGIHDVSPFWKFMTYIAPTRYALSAMATATLSCPCPTPFCEDLPGCYGVSLDTLEGPEITAWSLLQNVYGFEDRYVKDVVALVIYSVVFRLGAFLGYAFVNHTKR